MGNARWVLAWNWLSKAPASGEKEYKAEKGNAVPDCAKIVEISSPLWSH